MQNSLVRLGATVIYRSRTGDYSLAAIVTATADSINPLGVERGFVPAITAPDRVHLAVLTPGRIVGETPRHTAQIIDPDRELGDRQVSLTKLVGDQRLSRVTELEGNQFVAMTAFGGTYQEFDIPLWTDPERMQPGNRVVFGQDGYEYDQQTPGTWTYLR